MTQTLKRYGWRPDKPDFRDYRTTFAVIKAPASYFLDSKLLPPIRDQGQQGSCTGHATHGAVAYLRNLEKQPIDNPSPRFIYWNGRVIEGTTDQDSGCEIRDVVKAVNKWGVCDESLCRYSDSDYTTPPTKAAFAAAMQDVLKAYRRVNQDVQSLKLALIHKQPVVIGFSVYEEFESQVVAMTGEVPMPATTSRMVGGHAVWIVGYDNAHRKGCFRLANSWGPGWGNHGYFWMPYDYLANPDLSTDFWALQSVT
jgi:C1A family cysteine protease